MSNLTNTGIKTARLFGMVNAKGWNPVKGCNNKGCHLHPVNTGDCWAAQMCNRMAGPWAGSEANLKCGKSNAANNIQYPNNGYPAWKKVYDGIYKKLKTFKPTWLESQFEKQFPKERSCILVGYMTDIAYILEELIDEWVQKIIDKIRANNEERKKVGLPLHIFQFLTKDPTVYAHFEWPVNCQLGFTATNQNEFNERTQSLWMHKIKDLKAPDNRVFYAYLEPLRDRIDLLGAKAKGAYGWLDWIIVGGGSIQLHPEWVRSIRDQCQKLGIPFYFKGWSKKHIPMGHPFGKPTQLIFAPNPRKYKKIPGLGINWLDGKKWEQFPEVKNETGNT